MCKNVKEAIFVFGYFNLKFRHRISQNDFHEVSRLQLFYVLYFDRDPIFVVLLSSYSKKHFTTMLKNLTSYLVLFLWDTGHPSVQAF